MRQKAFVTMLALSLLAATGAWAIPFGTFDGLARGGNAGNGVVGLVGWALAETGVYSVDVVVDGGVIGEAAYGRSRPGVTKLYPNYPNSAAPGFAYQLDTTHFLNGLHTVTVRVTSEIGEVAYLNSLTFQFSNTNADLLPFGMIEFPNQQAEMSGDCNLTDTPRIESVVSGYALDVNASYNNPGVAYVELLIDGALWSNSQSDCHYDSDDFLTDCYGIKRLDLLQEFPGLKDAPHAGFRFELDVGLLIGTLRYAPGSHQIGIRVGDQFENVTDIGSIAVTFGCQDPKSDVAIGHIDFPVPGLLYGGVIQVSGWALDFENVAAVVIYIDGNVAAIAYPGLPRPDVVSEYPSYPVSPGGPGWYTYIDTTKPLPNGLAIPNGVHQLSAQVVDLNNVYSYITFIGNLPITIENPLP
jgi:hypothetical protein